jgi:uncharacterized membrane protein
MAFGGRATQTAKAIWSALERSPVASGTAATLIATGMVAGGAVVYEWMKAPAPSASPTALEGSMPALLKLIEEQTKLQREALEAANKRAEAAEVRAQATGKEVAALRDEVTALRKEVDATKSWSILTPFASLLGGPKTGKSADHDRSGPSPTGDLK